MITQWEDAMYDFDPEAVCEVYRNTNRKGVVYTIRQNGYVVAHADEVCLTNAEFHVSEAGRKRVKKTGTKNVHAWIRGDICLQKGEAGNWFGITYNPHKNKEFIRLDTGKPIKKATFVTLNQHGVFGDNSVNL